MKGTERRRILLWLIVARLAAERQKKEQKNDR